MCLFFLLQYFPAVIAVQISQHTLITLMAISWELVLKYQAKFIPSITDESSPCTPKQINSPTAKSPHPFLPCGRPSAASMVPLLTPTLAAGSALSDMLFPMSPAKAKILMLQMGPAAPEPGLISFKVLNICTNCGSQAVLKQ